MSRREKLIKSILTKGMEEESAKALDATLKLILSDMGSMYIKFWETEGPGLMCFQPDSDRTMFFMTFKELNSIYEHYETLNEHDLAETFRRILEAGQKINPEEKAGYIINDDKGIKYFEICYNQLSEN